MTTYRLSLRSTEQSRCITFPEEQLGDAIEMMVDNILCSWWEVVELWKYEHITETDDSCIIKRTRIFQFLDE